MKKPVPFQKIVMHAFDLRPVYRGVFLLCEIQRLKIDEAAVILRISPGAAALRLDRARREMHRRLREDRQDHHVDHQRLTSENSQQSVGKAAGR